MSSLTKHRLLVSLYEELLARYGCQGWWPVMDCPGTLAEKDGLHLGYHPGDYSYPHTQRQAFEICCGAILTQNTAWANARAALANLAALGTIEPEQLLRLPGDALARAIRPAGYFNVKARKLVVFARFFQGLNGRIPGREELRAVWGIGPETADSIRLYAYRQVEMVVDAYTRRILEHARLLPATTSYEAASQFCRESLPAELAVYQEFHALMVAHGKRFYSRRQVADPLAEGMRPGKPHGRLVPGSLSD